MRMPSLAWVRDLDGRAWRTATWSAPLLVQAVLGVLFLAMWALGQWPFATHNTYERERAWMLAATGCTMLTSLVFCAALMKSSAPRHRALALSLACTSVAVLIGATASLDVALKGL